MPEEPPAAVLSALFGDRTPLVRAFAEHLATSGVAQGLIGPHEVPRLWTRHLLNCAVVGALLPRDGRVVDVGSGAGLPGIVLALARPDVQVTLVEPLLRRVTWLQDVLAELGLDSVRVVRARADEVERGGADVATARAVAALDKLAAWCLPLVRPGGSLLAIKGRSARDELASAEATLSTLGAETWRVLEVGGEFLDELTTVVEVRAGRAIATPSRSKAGPARRSRST